MKKISLKAFSLIEVLIALITISIAASAFAPVITKKAQLVAGAGGGGTDSITMNCEAWENCNLCIKDQICEMSLLNPFR